MGVITRIEDLLDSSFGAEIGRAVGRLISQDKCSSDPRDALLFAAAHPRLRYSEALRSSLPISLSRKMEQMGKAHLLREDQESNPSSYSGFGFHIWLDVLDECNPIAYNSQGLFGKIGKVLPALSQDDAKLLMDHISSKPHIYKSNSNIAFIESAFYYGFKYLSPERQVGLLEYIKRYSDMHEKRYPARAHFVLPGQIMYSKDRAFEWFIDKVKSGKESAFIMSLWMHVLGRMNAVHSMGKDGLVIGAISKNPNSAYSRVAANILKYNQTLNNRIAARLSDLARKHPSSAFALDYLNEQEEQAKPASGTAAGNHGLMNVPIGLMREEMASTSNY